MRINAHPRSRRLFRLRSILLVAMLSVLFLPLSSLYFFRFYENELVQKTELELISQSAVIAATFREFIGKNTIIPVIPPSTTSDISPTIISQKDETHSKEKQSKNVSYFDVVIPQLDLSVQSVLPRRPVSIEATQQRDMEAWKAGEKLQTILANTQRVTLAGMRVLDANGIIVAGQHERGLSLAHIPEVREALKGNYTSVIRERISDEPTPPIASLSRGTGIRVFTAFPIKDNGKVYGVVYLSRTPKNILKHLYSVKGKVFLVLLGLLGLTSLLVVFLSARLSRPIRELITQTRQVTNGESNTVKLLREPGTYELAQLSHSFAAMSQTLDERSNYIKQFAAHVSHEFKTPLTSMQGALELLMEHDDMTREQQQKFMNNLLADTDRLSKLVSRLLQLAQADAMKPSKETTALCPILETLKQRYAEKGLQLEIAECEADLILKIDHQALEAIFINLFENSLQHGADKVHLQVTTAHAENTKKREKTNKITCTITIQDNGTGISQSNRKHIFTPFFTTRREGGGTGLGLGIIASLLETWHGEIALGESTKGALFHLKLDTVKTQLS